MYSLQQFVHLVHIQPVSLINDQDLVLGIERAKGTGPTQKGLADKLCDRVFDTVFESRATHQFERPDGSCTNSGFFLHQGGSRT
jgi:hypothetical protein